MNEPSLPPAPPAKRRINFGRRRSDWLIPLLMLTLVATAALWAYNSYLQRQDAEALKIGLQEITQLRERQLKNYEKKLETSAPKTAPPETAMPKKTSLPAR